MDDTAGLRDSLLSFLHARFRTRPDIDQHAEDIVQEAFLSLGSMASRGIDCVPRRNFAYLSVVCLRLAWRLFRRQSGDLARECQGADPDELVSEDDFVGELLRKAEAAEILRSFETLRELERVILLHRYYGQATFAEIAARHGLKLNTVLSHHRRALEKLRSRHCWNKDTGEETWKRWN